MRFCAFGMGAQEETLEPRGVSSIHDFRLKYVAAELPCGKPGDRVPPIKQGQYWRDTIERLNVERPVSELAPGREGDLSVPRRGRVSPTDPGSVRSGEPTGGDVPPGRPFTPDGHLVGSLAECYTEYYYGLTLHKRSNEGHDGLIGDLEIEVKATQGRAVALRSGPKHLLVFKLSREGAFEEVYNGPGAPVRSSLPRSHSENGQRQVLSVQLRRLMEGIALEDRLPLIRPIPRML